MDPLSILQTLVESGADCVEFDNASDGAYDVILISGSAGIGIARLGGMEGARLASRILRLKTATIGGLTYRVRAEQWESFGEQNYRFTVSVAEPGHQGSEQGTPRTRKPKPRART